jgi:CRP-like cAMP-binding protein
LTQDDIAVIHEAQSSSIDETHEAFVLKGKERLSAAGFDSLITPDVVQENAYLFLAGMEGVSALKEHLVYRRIQDKKYLSVDEVKRISREFMKMPQTFKNDLIDYVDDLLLPIQSEWGVLQKSELDLICNNISGALFGTINNEHLNQIFSETRIYHKGDVILTQNSLSKAMYFIKEGAVTLSLNGSPVASLAPGEIFGEISLFFDIKRTATIKAVTDKTEVGVLTRRKFENLLRRSQPYSYDLIYRLYRILPERLRNLNDKYKTAISALNLMFEGGKEKIAGHEGIHLAIKPKTDLLSTLTREEIETVFLELKALNKGQVIFSEGDRADGAYFILEGNAKAVTFSNDHQEIILGELGRDEIFGEMALVDNKSRSATIVATSPCKVAFVEKKSFNDKIETRSELSYRLMALICL